MNRPFRLFVAGLLSSGPLLAAVQLASPFTDHMVLQRELPVPVWGTAAPGENITVTFAGRASTVQAGATGAWRVDLAPLPASAESRDFIVTGSATPAPLQLHDVLVGEVWLASGQSNMDFTVAKTPRYYFAGVINEAAEVAAANYPQIRMFTGEPIRSYEPKPRVPGSWRVCTPRTVREFSAIGYFFARDLQQALHVPVGIVTLAYGASCAQAWIRRETIAADPLLKPLLDEFDAKVRVYIPPDAAGFADWQKTADQATAAGRKPPPRPHPDPVQDQHNPTVLFNGLVAPMVPYAIRGVLWYQGESITPPRELFPHWNETLINDWRRLWGRELPFYFCQLAALGGKGDLPQVRAWQAEALRLPATGMAVTIDVGDEKDVHPHNKAPVGDRLARIALAQVYGRTLEFSGPVFSSLTVRGGTAQIAFTHVGGGLVARDGPLKTFELAGADGQFVSAEAVIDGETVTVQSAAIPTPMAVRYAWSNYPTGCNLANAAGLPAAPFQAALTHP